MFRETRFRVWKEGAERGGGAMGMSLQQGKFPKCGGEDFTTM